MTTEKKHIAVLQKLTKGSQPIAVHRLRRELNDIITHLSKVGETRKLIRQAVADYKYSEGCSCCRNIDAHKEHDEVLAKLLRVNKYADGSGYDWSKYRSKK